MVNGIGPPNDWDSLYLEPGIMKHDSANVARRRRAQRRSADYLRKRHHRRLGQTRLHGRDRQYHLGMRRLRHVFRTGRQGVLSAGHQQRRRRQRGGSGPVGGGTYGTPEYTPFTSAHLINFEWLQHEAGDNQIFPASADLKDVAGRTVISSYAVHRPDGNWSLMLINHDLNAAHQVHLAIDDANQKARSFADPVHIVQHCNTPSENKNETMKPPTDGIFALPIGSITILRGKLE